MSSREPDFWLRELARTGLSTADQQELLASLSNAAETRARYFPVDPLAYVDRVRRFLMHTFSRRWVPYYFPWIRCTLLNAYLGASVGRLRTWNCRFWMGPAARWMDYTLPSRRPLGLLPGTSFR